MQNSGIGNLLNNWASLAHNYAMAVPWIVSDRGSSGEAVAALAMPQTGAELPAPSGVPS
jgi:sulfopyruvate decarboxylase TPP-binding subunit